MALFAGFTRRRIRTSGATIHLATGGAGPPLLLLHGYPETHAMWHKMAPALAREYTVVCPDLRGYGDSSKPKGLPDHSNYSKRAMAQDMAEVMTRLGHRGFQLVGHDRGARVAHRLARDHGKRVRTLTVLDIAPTLKMYESTDMAFADILKQEGGLRVEQRIECAQKIRESGNNLYKSSQYPEALHQYNKSLRYLLEDFDSPQEMDQLKVFSI
jgi:pimeloyl-ACP methyl ester carboxylesterase